MNKKDRLYYVIAVLCITTMKMCHVHYTNYIETLSS